MSECTYNEAHATLFGNDKLKTPLSNDGNTNANKYFFEYSQYRSNFYPNNQHYTSYEYNLPAHHPSYYYNTSHNPHQTKTDGYPTYQATYEEERSGEEDYLHQHYEQQNQQHYLQQKQQLFLTKYFNFRQENYPFKNFDFFPHISPNASLPDIQFCPLKETPTSSPLFKQSQCSEEQQKPVEISKQQKTYFGKDVIPETCHSFTREAFSENGSDNHENECSNADSCTSPTSACTFKQPCSNNTIYSSTNPVIYPWMKLNSSQNGDSFWGLYKGLCAFHRVYVK